MIVDGPEPKNYFPLKDQTKLLYEVINTTYSITEAPIVERYFLLETYTQTASNNYIINTQITTPDLAYIPFKSQVLEKEGANYLLKDNGLITLIMRDNLSLNSTFDYNTFNINAEKIARVTAIDQPADGFANSLTLTFQADSSLINKDVEIRKYADGTGLYYEEITHISYCQSSPECIGTGQIVSGSSYIKRNIPMSLID